MQLAKTPRRYKKKKNTVTTVNAISGVNGLPNANEYVPNVAKEACNKSANI